MNDPLNSEDRSTEDLNNGGHIYAQEVYGTALERVRTQRKSNNGSNAHTSRGQSNGRTGGLDSRKPTSNANGNRSESSGNQSRLTKFSKQTEPPQGGSFNGNDLDDFDIEDIWGEGLSRDAQSAESYRAEKMNDPLNSEGRSTNHEKCAIDCMLVTP